MIDSKSTKLKDILYPKVSASLSKPENVKIYKSNIDHYMASHIESYSSIGPSTRPTLMPSDMKNLYSVLGITDTEIMATLKQIKGNTNGGKYFNNPYNISICLSIQYFTIKKNQEMINVGLTYMITSIYQYTFHKYYKVFNPNEAVMAYTIANLSQKFKIKKYGTILAALQDIINICYDTHRTRLADGSDLNIARFINDVVSRFNSFMRKLTNEYTENYKNQNYLQSERDDYSDEHFYEADNDSFIVDRITNKVLTSLVVNGPDRKLIELAAKNSSVSVNMMQTCIMTLISENNREDIKTIIERTISLYLTDNPDKSASIKDLGTNKFYVYCIRLYRNSNTTNENIIKIKTILDKWIDELELKNKVSTVQSLGNYRKALFMFFVFTIEKLC